ncbi:hypothetical protein PG994_003366 [Apiospora phragmitis]|uniref:JmjC domain-containing protein n=1 Tax=Apiospora phragmitis TaxID=2905665 RepID=A0ABR1VY07_9PEZI
MNVWQDGQVVRARAQFYRPNGIFKEIAKGANSPRNTIVVACGDASFTGSIRDEVIQNASMQFAEVEFRPTRASQESLVARATPLKRIRRRRFRVSDPESLALAREGNLQTSPDAALPMSSLLEGLSKESGEPISNVVVYCNQDHAFNAALSYLSTAEWSRGDPITACQYLGRSEFKRTEFVICLTEEAKVLLEAKSPQVPILILTELNKDDSRLSLDRYLDYLRAFPTLDIHDFQDEIPDDVITPRSVDLATAISMFRDHSRAPINMLNPRGYKANPVPSCLAGLPDYAIMEYAREQSGKLEHSKIFDLADSVTFYLCGKKGAFSMPHIDRHGVHTTVFIDDGLKLWAFWPAAELVDWAESGSLPSAPGVSLYLYLGCILLQPRGTIHAPYSMTDVLMSGTIYPHITNEDMAKEFVAKVGLIRSLWQSKSPAWSWGSDEQFKEYSKLVQWFESRVRKSTKPRRKRRT